MIEHRAYGNDDPYKSSPTERFPRDPAPGDAVQIGFRTGSDATAAWCEVRHAAAGSVPQDAQRVEAVSLGGGLWTADIGPFEGGRVEYRLVAEHAGGRTDTADFGFEVGRWVRVTTVTRTELDGGRLIVGLQTDAGSDAELVISFPTNGACRCELYVGSAPKNGNEYLTTRPISPVPEPTDSSKLSDSPELSDTPGLARIAGPDIELELDKRALTLSARHTSAHAESAANGFSVSLAVRWLVRPDAFSTPVEVDFRYADGERLYGLGERFVDAERGGQSWDVRVYEEYKEQRARTYIPVPFLVSNLGNGLWLDSDEPSYFDLNQTGSTIRCDRLRDGRAASQAGAMPLLALVVFAAPKPYGVTAAFTRLTGAIEVPPKWAFGPWMSANTWNSQALAEEVVDRTLAEDVPASVIVLEAWSDEATFYIFNDAEYQPVDGSKALRHTDFRYTGRWPDPKAMIDHFHANGVRVVLWQIPVHKHVGEPHAQHDADGRHMIEHDYAILNADGSPYRNKGWWFTDALVTDFSNPDAERWWFDKRRYLFDDLGIDGFKTDGGEHLWGRDLRAYDGSRGIELYNTYANRYVSAYHSFVQQATGNDGVTFSRSGYTGAQRHPIHWAGDEDSTWNAYRASIKAGLSAGVSGISMWSYDIAGFSGEIPPADLYLRSTAMAALCPVMQYHSEPHGATERRDRTPWNIGERHGDPTVLPTYRRYAKLRMRLLNYLHGEAHATAAAGIPLMRYPALEYPAAHDHLAQDEYAYLLGRDLLVAPVTERGVGTREVRLPPGAWVDAWSGAKIEGDRLFHAPAPIDRIPVFVKADSPRLDHLLDAFAAWHDDAQDAPNTASPAGA